MRGNQMEAMLESLSERLETKDGGVPQALSRVARKNPDKTAFWRMEQRRWVPVSWMEYWGKVEKLASLMEGFGLKPGDRVAVVLPTSMEWEIVDKAALCLGLVVVGLEPHMAVDTMVSVIQGVRPSALFTFDKGLAGRLRESLDEPLKLCVSQDRWSGNYPGVLAWETLLNMESGPVPRTTYPVDGSTVATQLLTSGTNGALKAVVHTHAQVLLAARSILSTMGPFKPSDSTVAWLPMANPFQRYTNMAALLAGMPFYLLSDPRKLVETLPVTRPTVLIGVPRVFEKIYLAVRDRIDCLPHLARPLAKALLKTALSRAPRSSQENRHLGIQRRLFFILLRSFFLRKVRQSLGGRMRFMVSGSAACREDVLLFFSALGVPLLEAYGASECSVPVCMNRPHNYRLGTVGMPTAPNTVRLSHENEVVVGGPAVFKGYAGEESPTPSLTPEGHLLTGDLAEFDSEGYLVFTGRKSELIKTSTGRKIALLPIERKILEESDIDQIVLAGNNRAGPVAIVTFDPKRLASVPLRVRAEQLREILRRVNESMKPLDRVRGCLALGEPFSMERDEVTRNLKLRRTEIERTHRETLDTLYEKIRPTSAIACGPEPLADRDGFWFTLP